MKKCCFLIFITIITIIVAISIYLFKNNGEIFKKVSKEKILEFAYNKLNENIDQKLIPNEFKDSLKILMQKEFNYLKKENFDTAMKKFGQIADLVKDFSLDKKIDSTEFSQLKKMVSYHERSKKN